jgi:subtilase family protein
MTFALRSLTTSAPAVLSHGRQLPVSFLLALALAFVGHASEAADRFPLSPVDMIVVPYQGQTFIVLADPSSGSIYWSPLEGDKPGEVPYFLFQELLHSPEFATPTALAYWKGKLIFIDRRTSRLVELDLDSRGTRVLLGSPELRDPVSLAVSEDGLIAIGEDGPDAVLLVRPEAAGSCAPKILASGFPAENCPTKPPRKLAVNFDEPDRLSFVGPDLLILDTESRTITAVPGYKRSNSASAAAETTVDMIHSRFPRVREFAYFRGIYYIVDGERIVALSTSGNTSSPLPYPAVDPPRLAASDHLLLIRGQESVLLWSRPIPVSVSFELVGSESPLEIDSSQYLAIASLYAYLHKHSMLPVQDHEIQRDYATLRELLFEKDILIRRPTAPGLPAYNAEADAKIAKVLCDLNDFHCSPGSAAAILDRRLSAGETVRLPRLPMEKSLTSGKVSLAAKTVEEHLRERVLPEQLPQINNDYLYRINRQFLRTWEAFNARENLVVVDRPRADLGPGTLVRLEQGNLLPLTDLEGCGVERGEIRSRVVQSRPLLPIASQRDILPRQSSFSGDPEPAFKLGVQISFDELVRESLEPTFLPRAAAALRTDGRCLSLLQDPQVYVVIEAQKALGARYNVLNKKGSPLWLSDLEITKMNLRGHSDADKRWSLVVDDSLYVAVRLAKLDENIGTVRTATSQEINEAQDFLESENPVLNLPATKWRLRTFVQPQDLIAAGSEITRIANLPGVNVLSEESVLAAPQADGAPDWPSEPSIISDDEAKDLIRANRKRLLEMIHYCAPLPGASEIVVGVGEKKRSVHWYHPDFLTESGSLWRQVSPPEPGSQPFQPIPRLASDPALGTPLLKKFSIDDDHGDHVAGILAAHSQFAPGLIPGIGLFLIDTTSPAGLEESIDAAIQRGIDIFSFSFTIDKSDPTLDNLKLAMSNKWQNQIFVAAAGNDGKDLKSISARVPVSWGDDLENIIGVSAADWEYNVLGAWLPDPSQEPESGSNFGKKYVQLAAPGHRVFSTASDNRYALASGSSQAVPFVTAAVTMLASQMQFRAPWLIKARLIYTADWFSPNFDDKIWGGLLNYKRAVWQPALNLVTYKSDRQKVYSVDLADNSAISIGDGSIDERRGVLIERPREIPFRNILRIQWIESEDRYRVIYLEESTRMMRILKGAALSGQIPCKKLQPWNPEKSSFGDAEQCKQEISSVYNYVAAIPRVNKINF